MSPTATGEKEGSELGTPQTPAGGLRPPAPPTEQLRPLFIRAYTSHTL